MYCGRCGAQINDDSRFCRHCGAAQEPIESEQPLDGARARKRIAVAGTSDEPATAKPVNTTGRIIGIVAAVLLIITFIGSVISAPVPTGGFEESANTQTDLEAVDKLEQMAAPTTSVAAGAAAWTYATNEDKVRGSKDYTASTTSTNTVHQAPPYDSATTMNMVVRQSAAYGTDVILTISSGQFMCPSYEGCSGTVRFDDGSAHPLQWPRRQQQ